MNAHPTLAAPLLLALVAPLSSQNARLPQTVASSSSGIGAAVASAGDVSAIVYGDQATNELYLLTSDGRGLDWAAPVRIDSQPGLFDYLSGASIAIVDSRIYVAYADDRFGGRELFLRSYNLATETLSAEVRIPNDYAPGVASTFGWDLAAAAGTSADHVYFTIAVDQPSPNIERARFVASHDGGASFPIERALTPVGVDLDAAYQVEAAGGVVHVAWSDSRHAAGSNDVFYQRSVDGGATFLPADVQLDASGPGVGDVSGIGFHLTAVAPMVAVGWSEEFSSILDVEIHAIVSSDNGTSFGSDQRIDQAPARTQVGFVTVAVVPDPDTGSVAVGWTDNRFGGLEQTELFVATTFDDGNTWNETQVSNGGIFGLAAERNSAPEADGRGWMSFGYAGYFTGEVFSASSTDGGATWQTPTSLAGTPVPNQVSGGAFATNALYGNRIHVWPESQLFGPANLVVGGYRVPTLDVLEQSQVPSLHFEFEEFGDAAFGAVLLSGGTGSLPLGFGDGRDVGLLVDGLLLSSVQQAFGILGVSLTNGAGATPTIAISLPPGLDLFAVGVSFDLTGGLAIAELSDVVKIGD